MMDVSAFDGVISDVFAAVSVPAISVSAVVKMRITYTPPSISGIML